MSLIRDTCLVLNFQIKLIRARKEEIQYVKTVVLKIVGSGEHEPAPFY